MSMSARIKSTAGGDTQNPTVASGTTIFVPDETNFVSLSGSATCTSLRAGNHTRNRLVWFMSASGSTVLSDNHSAGVAGTMDLGGGGDITLGETDVICLLLRGDGTWLRATGVANN